MAGTRINLDKLPPKPDDALPDSTDPHGPCPRCGRLSNFTVVGKGPVTYADGTYVEHPVAAVAASIGELRGNRLHVEQLSLLECQGCHQNIVVIEEQYVGGVKGGMFKGRGGAVQWRGVHWWPTPGMRSAEPDIPAEVADAVAEGTRCLAVRAPRAAAVMYRAALALLVVDKGSAVAQSKKTLAAQLSQMAVDGDLDRTLAEWAGHIRLTGNAAAHPSELAPVTQDEAAELSRLIGALLDYLYVMPARVQRARAARP